MKTAAIGCLALLGSAQLSCQKAATLLTRLAGAPAAVPSPAPVSSGEPGTKAEVVKRNSQILQEIYRVVWVTNPPSPSEFGNWLDSINQGASFEGVYNAFTHSGGQRERESDRRTTASPRAIGVFSEQLAGLLLQFPKVPDLSEIDPAPDQPPTESKPQVIVFAPLAKDRSAGDSRPTRGSLAGQLGSRFAGASVYTLKRVLGDWALKFMAQKREESQELFWGWYADFATAASALNVDFGLAPRNEESREFHRDWASKNSDDLIRWEVLNRLHRILNEAQPLRLAGNEGNT